MVWNALGDAIWGILRGRARGARDLSIEEDAGMADPAGKGATYEDLFDIPENMIGEIIDGELIVTPSASMVDHSITCDE